MKKMFKKYGKIVEFSWKGKFFFVVMMSLVLSRKAYDDKHSAKKAVRKMNNEEIHGYSLIVEFAK
jgi:arginine/serine-rich splicing factor 7